MATTRIYVSDRLRKEWNGETRTYTEWDNDGNLIGTRPFIDSENARADAEELKEVEDSNASTLKSRSDSALSTNRDFLDTPLGSLTQADVALQVRALTKQNNALIRYAFKKLEDISDTE
jgi:hypothetical protein